MNDSARTEQKPPRRNRRHADDTLDDLRTDFEIHRKEQQLAMSNLLTATQANTDAVTQLTESTQGIVVLYGDLQAAARVGLALQRFVVWVGGLGAAGAVVAGGLHWFLDFFKLGS